MSLNTAAIKDELKAVFDTAQAQGNGYEAQKDAFLTGLAQTIVDAIQSATIVYQGGLVAPNGPVSGTFEGELQ